MIQGSEGKLSTLDVGLRQYVSFCDGGAPMLGVEVLAFAASAPACAKGGLLAVYQESLVFAAASTTIAVMLSRPP